MKPSFISLQKMYQYFPEGSLLHVENTSLTIPLRNISTDSRKIKEGDFFIAIRGEKFDGNTFLHETFKKGALAVMASDATLVPDGCPTLLVENTLTAMQQIAKEWRLELAPLLVLVTGSNGKTTVKEMIASIFSQAVGPYRTLATPGNLNNEIGLPLTLLGLNGEHQLAVIELGMNHPGETKFLAEIASPDIAYINNAQREHQEFMHTVEAVAKEHGDAISALADDGIAVFPADSEYTPIWVGLAKARTYYDFCLVADGEKSSAKVQGSWLSHQRLEIRFPNHQKIQVRLQTFGDHNAKNAIGAATVAFAAKLELETIRAGLEKFEPVAGRMRGHALPHFEGNGTLIDDTYNANPDSVIAAIDVLQTLPGTRWLVLGDMGEVGDQGVVFHEEVGRYAQQKGIEHLYATGELSQYAVNEFNKHVITSLTNGSKDALHFSDAKQLLKTLKVELQKIHSQSGHSEVAVLVKGSRFTRMERIVQCLLKEESLCF